MKKKDLKKRRSEKRKIWEKFGNKYNINYSELQNFGTSELQYFLLFKIRTNATKTCRCIVNESKNCNQKVFHSYHSNLQNRHL